jgi:hypothetical protein
MTDDNIVQLPPRDGRPCSANACDTNEPIMIATVDEPSPEFSRLDLDSLFNMREWVRSALEANGAKCVGAGIGCGGAMGIADVQIELDGHQYNIEIRPLAALAR